jgi:uncharacterized protein involved in outer membrane biogenesis
VVSNTKHDWSEPDAPHRRFAFSRVPRPVWWTLGVIGLLAVGIALFLALFDWNMLRGPIAREASRRSGRPVRIDGDLKVHLLSWTPSATVGKLTIGNPPWMHGGQLAQIQQFGVSIKLLPLLIGRVELPMVDLEQANIALFRDADDHANWRGDPRNAKPLKLPPIQHLIIRDGHLHWVDEKRKMVLTGTIQSQETHVGPDQNARGSFALNGAGTLNGDPFSVHVTGGALLNVRRNQPYHFDGDITAARTHVIAHGTLPRPFDLGQVDTRVDVTGANFADLYYLTGFAFPTTSPYRLSGHMVRDEKRYRFTDVVGRVGQSDLEGDFIADDTTGRPNLKADLRSRNVNYKDLGSLIGAPPVAQRTAEQQAQADTQAAQGRFLPDAKLDLTRVRSMDAQVKYRADSVTAPAHLPLRKVRIDLTLDHGVMTLDPLAFTMPRGEVAGRVRIDARRDVPHSDIDMKMLNMRVEDFFKASANAPLEGTLEARAVLHGDGDTVHRVASTANGTFTVVVPRGRMRKEFAELLGINVTKALGLYLTGDKSDTGLRCAVADFRATNGVLYAQNFIVDTDVVRSEGKGNIALGPETMDLELTGKPKQFRLFHLSAPITVTGHLKSPKFGVKPGAAPLQAAGAVALGVVLPPLAVILPFVDPGLAKDANCVGLVSNAQAKGAPVRVSSTTATPSKHR